MIVPNAAAKTPTESSEELITISPTLILRAYANTPNAPLNSVVERMPSFLSCLKRKGKESSPSETSNLIHEDGSSSPSADDDHSSTNSIGDNVGGGKDISFWGGLALLVNSITGPGKLYNLLWSNLQWMKKFTNWCYHFNIKGWLRSQSSFNKLGGSRKLISRYYLLFVSTYLLTMNNYYSFGFFRPVVTMLIIMVISALSASLLCQAMALIPGNEKFQVSLLSR